MEKISVIIPLYNKASTVARAVQSVLEQQEANAEVIVVDDGSTDSPEQKLAPFRGSITYVSQPNAGPAAARNRGVAASTGRYIAFLDADDEYRPGCLRAHLRCREHYPGVKVTLSPFRMLATGDIACEERLEKKVPNAIERNGFIYSEHFIFELVVNANSGYICLDRDLYDAIGGFDTELRCWEITDFAVRALIASPVVGILDQIYVINHQDEGNSQFARAHTDPAYTRRFADNLLDQLPRIPESQHAPLLRQVRILIRKLLIAGAIAQFRELATRACPHLKNNGLFTRLCTLSRAPTPVVRAGRLIVAVTAKDR